MTDLTRGDLEEMSRDALIDLCLALNALAVSRDRLLAAMPECPVHGHCVPFALEWLREVRAREAAARYGVGSDASASG